MVSSFPKRFCKAYLPLIPVFDLGAQLDSIAKFVPQSQTNQEVNKKRLATKTKTIREYQTNKAAEKRKTEK